MRVILMHNASAGSQRHDADELAELIEAAGHDVVRVVSRKKELEAALERSCDLVAVCGGDGTVGKVASVVKRTVPLAILPAGTANNLARSLGLRGELPELIADWNRSEPRGFDAATVTWRNGKRRQRSFYEACGFGAFPRAMRLAERAELEAPFDGAEPTLRRDRVVLREAVATAPVRDYQITVDGEDHGGAYLLVEAMLIPSIGPNVALAPRLDPHDGLLDVVLVSEQQRALLVTELDELIKGVPVDWRLEHLRGRDVEIEVDEDIFHADGDLCDEKSHAFRGGHVELVSYRDAFELLVPPPA